MPELRQNPINKHWVVIAKERAKRPQDFIRVKEKDTKPVKDCPFEQGNEDKTPSEVLVFPSEPKRKLNTKGWIVRVFPNLFPAFSSGKSFHLKQKGFHVWAEAAGSHEVIATRDHEKTLALLPEDHITYMLQAYKERMMYYRDSSFIKYCLAIYNHGKEAGASLSHPHSQFFALPLVSNYILDELRHEKKFQKLHGMCGYCAIIGQELKENKRIINKNKSFISFAPFSSREPFEVVIFPRDHQPNFWASTDEQLQDLAMILKDALARIYHGLKDPNFNYYLHTAPLEKGKNYDFSHWHLKILPRLSVRAGFELGTGIIINVVPPENAATFLRDEVILPDTM